MKPVQAVLRAARYLRGEDVEPYEGPDMVDASYFVEMPSADDSGESELDGPELAGSDRKLRHRQNL